nr:hypothetical protein [Chloroflexota bacterium]
MDTFIADMIGKTMGAAARKVRRSRSIIEDLLEGIASYPFAIAAALVVAWTGFTAAILLGTIGAIVGAVVALVVAMQQ